MTLTLRPVTRATLDAVLALQVTEPQRRFVAPNLLSMAQAAVMPELCPRGVYAGEMLVGFALYGLDPEEQAYCIDRLMIDAAYQGLGYGCGALRLLMAEIRAQRPARPVVYLSVLPDNEAAIALYTRFGFVPDGRTVDGETVYRFQL